MFLISACLLGRDVKYNGGNNRNEAVLKFCQGRSILPVCPETAAQLPVPREPAEYQADGRIVDRAGVDRTENFRRGAERMMDYAIREAEIRGEDIEGAILKAKSPSCGSGKIYDGSFTGALVAGNGCFTRMLAERGIPVVGEDALDDEGTSPFK